MNMKMLTHMNRKLGPSLLQRNILNSIARQVNEYYNDLGTEFPAVEFEPDPPVEFEPDPAVENSGSYT